MTSAGRFIFAAAILAVCLRPASAQLNNPKFTDGVTINQKLGQQVPLDLVFKDESGKSVKLADYFDGKHPVILTLVYFGCPNLCTLELNDLTRSMNGMDLSAGDDFQVLTVSFDPKESPALAADKKETYLQSYRRPNAAQGWHFLTGDQASIHALTDAVGFRYKWDQKFNQYIHPSGLMILTPTGTVSRYFFGIDYELKDLKLSLINASGNKIGNIISNEFLLFCFHYDETSGKYTLAITRLMQVGAVLTMAALGTFWFVMFRREHHGHKL